MQGCMLLLLLLFLVSQHVEIKTILRQMKYDNRYNVHPNHGKTFSGLDFTVTCSLLYHLRFKTTMEGVRKWIAFNLTCFQGIVHHVFTCNDQINKGYSVSALYENHPQANQISDNSMCKCSFVFNTWMLLDLLMLWVFVRVWIQEKELRVKRWKLLMNQVGK